MSNEQIRSTTNTDQDEQERDLLRRLKEENEDLRKQLAAKAKRKTRARSTPSRDGAAAKSADADAVDSPLQSIAKEVDQRVQSNPVAGMIVAFGVGLVVARLLGARR